MRKLAIAIVAAVGAIGVLGPLIATELPWFAVVDGSARFPAFAGWAGADQPPPAGAASWRAWWTDADDDAWVVLAPVPFDPHRANPDAFYAGPSALHPCGNDDTGRDVLARLVHGAATAARVALVVVLLAGAAGVLAGGAAGLAGGVVDVVVLRVIELFLCFPALVLVLCVAAFVSGSRSAVIAVLACVYWTSFARIVRGELLSLRERPFVAVARGLGVGRWRVLTRHVLPQVVGSIGVVAAFVAANSIVVESTLRFLGLGSFGDDVSWGAMVAQFRLARAAAWHVWVFPAAAIVVTVLALHGLGPRREPDAEA